MWRLLLSSGFHCVQSKATTRLDMCDDRGTAISTCIKTNGVHEHERRASARLAFGAVTSVLVLRREGLVDHDLPKDTREALAHTQEQTVQALARFGPTRSK